MSRQLLIDAMNVIGSRADRWWNDPDRAIRRMTATLDDFAASIDESVVVVLDKDPGALPEVSHAQIVVARRKGRNAADYEIERMVAEAEDPSLLTVVTSDKRLVEKVRSLGAGVTGAGAFRRRLDSPSS